jgi:hypothetical protein
MARNVSDLDIEDILRIDVDLAQQELDAARLAFWRAAAAPPNGEGTKKRENAAVAGENSARENLIGALHRLNEFICDGKVPEKL